MLDFAPVPRKHRHDGWTPERQRGFIEALADTGSVERACRAVNMSTEGAYHLRRQPGAEGFRAAWAAALDLGVHRLADIAMDRARDGVPVPVFHKGEQVGERRRYNDRLLMFILRHHMPDRYGAATIGGGTRSTHTIEREAAENCPTCRARREAEAADAETDAEAAWLDEVFRRYMLTLRVEHEARRDGRWTAADFAMRQLTHIELVLDMGGRTLDMLDRFAFRPSEHGHGPVPLHAGEASRLLAERREAYWASVADPPRPPRYLGRELPSHAIWSGDTSAERERARKDAERRIADAQAEWKAASSDETWAEWKADRS